MCVCGADLRSNTDRKRSMASLAQHPRSQCDANRPNEVTSHFRDGKEEKGGMKGASYHHGHKYVGFATLPYPHAGKDMGAKLAKIKLAKEQTCNNQNFNTDSPRHDALATSPRPILLAGNICISVTHFRMRSRASVPLEIWWILILPFFITCATAASMRGQ